MMDDDLKRSILISHYEKPHNYGLIEDSHYKNLHMSSSSCIDDLTIQVAIEGNIVKDVRFAGYGCTISKASTSILSDLIKGKTRQEALHILQEYKAMLQEKSFDEDTLEEANAFDTLYRQPNRIHCGSIGMEAMETLIKESLVNDK